MTSQSRRQALAALLQDGRIHRAKDLAQRFAVSERTLYRDMKHLQAHGVPIQGVQGTGYRVTAEITLPPLNLSGTELEVLRLGLAVLRDAGDEAQKQAAQALEDKLNAALTEGPAGLATAPVGVAPWQQQHLAQIRSAIAARQKLRVSLANRTTTIRPLRLDFFGRIWRCVCWDEGQEAFQSLPLSGIHRVSVLPGLFIDEPGKTLKDYLLTATGRP